eukprot:1456154-Amphidinium_carterae.1
MSDVVENQILHQQLNFIALYKRINFWTQSLAGSLSEYANCARFQKGLLFFKGRVMAACSRIQDQSTLYTASTVCSFLLRGVLSMMGVGFHESLSCRGVIRGLKGLVLYEGS